MYFISTMILGNPHYKENDTVNVDFVVTFDKPVDSNDLYVELTGGGQTVKVQSFPLDACDYRESDKETGPAYTGYHFEFNLTGLKCGEEYTYTLKSLSGEQLQVLPGVGEDTGHLLQPATFLAPPKPGETHHVHLVASADQEGMDLIHHISIDDKLAKLLKLGLDHRQLTTDIYKEIARRHPHMFFQMGDIFHGENLIVQGQVKSLAEFRKHLADDFHDTARDSLQETLSFRALDDHDLGANAVDAAAYKKEAWPFENALRAFDEFWPVPYTLADEARGLFYKVTYGDLDIWFLHNRLYTDDTTNLGDKQRAWLKDTLTASTAKAKIIVTPLPFVMGKSPDEDYRGYPAEFDELLTLFAKNDVSAIFTADSHNYSRTDLSIKLEDREVVIPQFLVGILGGRPQAVSKEERKKMPQTLLPEAYVDKYADTAVQSYYSPLDKPGSGVISLPGKKKYRAFDGEEWIGEGVAKNQYGFLDVDFDFEKGTFHTSLFTMRKKASKKAFMTDEADYPLKPKSVKLS